MKRFAFLPFAVLLGLVSLEAVATPITTLPETHVVAKDESLSVIAKKTGYSWQVLYAANRGRISNPNAVGVGWKLVLPSKGTNPKAAVATAVPQAESGYRVYNASTDFLWSPGLDSVKNAGPKAGPRAVAEVLSSPDKVQAGRVWDEIGRVGYNAKVFVQENGTLAVRTNDGDVIDLTGSKMVGGHSVVNFPDGGLRVKSGTLTDTRATVVYTPEGQAIVRMAICDNILPGKTRRKITVVQPAPEAKERKPLCVTEGMEFAQYGSGTNYHGHSAVFGGELACLHRVGDRLEVGFMGHASRGFFDDMQGRGRSDGLHVGGRGRYSAEDGSVYKLDVAVGPGSLQWDSKDRTAHIKKFSGTDVWVAPTWEKCVTNKLCLEAMGYGTFPITGRRDLVTGDGWTNPNGALRGATWGGGLRAGYDVDPSWPVIPEAYVGFMGMEGAKNLGFRATVGARTRDRSFRGWVGMEWWTGNTFVAGLEHDWGGKALYLDGKGRQDEVDGAQVVSVDTPVNLAKGSPKVKSKPVVAKAQQVKVKAAHEGIGDTAQESFLHARVRNPAPSTPAQIAKTEKANSGFFNCFAAASGCGG